MTKTTSSVTFMLGDEVRTLSNPSPTMTVLDYLRTIERRTGTKEGCGEGDCGACTVVVGEPIDGRMRYRAVNACIQFLPTLHGRQLLTVESLANANGDLHPAQKAMVDCHGSQCGFCTPGFVMSLFALYRSEQGLDRDGVNDALAGNLCRCTGYGPIVDAALAMRKIGPLGGEPPNERLALEGLGKISTDETVAIETGGQKFFAPTSGDELARICAENPDAMILSGGTDVGLWVTKQGRRLETVIYIGRARDLQRIDVDDKEIAVWAGATQTDTWPIIAKHYPDFGELLRRFGATQVRNAGTMCGNVANGSPIGDSPPALIALDARVGLRYGGDRREIPIEDFFVDYGVQDRKPGEFVEKIILPVADPARGFAAYKLSKRFDQDISAVCGAFNYKLEGDRLVDIRIAYGGMATTPKRASNAEQAMRGQVWNEETVQAGMNAMEADFQPISDMRASADYRIRSAKNLIRKVYLETTQKDGAPLRLAGGQGQAHVTA